MRLNIIGTKGFIGSRMYEYFLSKKDYSLVGYSSLECNLLSEKSTNMALANLKSDDIIVMASAITRLKEDSLDALIKNMTMAENIAKIIEKKTISQFVFLSTTDVYGFNPILPINEDTLPNPQDYYAISKLSSEFILRQTCLRKDIPLLILRLPGVYGKGDHGKSTLNKLVESAKNKKITIFGSGDDKRDFVYIEDLCKIVELGINQRINSTMNIATGNSNSIRDISELIRMNFSSEVSIEYLPETTSQKRAKEMKFDISKLKRTFPYFKFTSIQEGIKLYLNGLFN
jgi:UDP-glucose 4-epimerase